MKKFLSFAILALALTACSSSNDEPQQPKQNVEVSLSYIFADNGDMARSTGSEVYTTFYNNQIKTKKLTPQHYNLTFTDNNGATFTMESYWNKNSKFNILEGEYTVTGTSSPTTKTTDTLYLKFNEKITIKKENPNITLTAINNCFLLMLNSEQIKSVSLEAYDFVGDKKNNYTLSKTDNVYFLFAQSFYKSYYGTNIMSITYNDGRNSNISDLEEIPFEKGKYYYFNEVSNSFDIPAMEEGN